MSGAEALAVLGVISSIIAIVDGTKQVYDAAGDAHGLPSAFREVASRLPIVENILRTAERRITDKEVDNETCKGMISVVDACKDKADQLEKLFEKVIPGDGASRTERYLKAVRTLGKGTRVELLMREVLENVQLLASDHGMKAATKSEIDQIVKAITDISGLPSSVEEHAERETSFTNINKDNAQQTNYQAQGDIYTNPGSGSMYNAQSMSFGGGVSMQKALFYVQTLQLMSPSVLKDPEVRKAIENGSLNLDEVEGVGAHISKIEEECLQSLAFPQLGLRQRNIKRAYGNTGRWPLKHPQFKDWSQRDNLDDHYGLLWLKGGPGSGKSTLMNEAYLSVGSDPSSITAAYFASRKGEVLEKSSHGLIRTLLLQILPKHREMLADLVQIYQRRKAEEGSSWTWTTQQLLAFMEKRLVQSGGTTFSIFIDGLDEFPENEARDLVGYFRKLTLSASASGAKVNVCLSSRNYPNITTHLCPEINVESQNKHDISDYITSRLFEHQSIADTVKVALAKDIIEKSSGSFLWVVIVVAQLNEDFDKGRSTQTMVDRLDQTSKKLAGMYDMYGMYALLFEDAEDDEIDEIRRFWQCINFATRPLRLTEFQQLFAWTANPPPKSIGQWIATEGQGLNDGERLIRYITTLSRGLIDVRLKQAPLRKVAAAASAKEHSIDVLDENNDGIGDTRQQTQHEVQEQPEDNTQLHDVGDLLSTESEHVVASTSHIGAEETKVENASQNFLDSLLNMVDWEKGANFHFTADLKPEALEPGSNSFWRMFLEGPWEPIPLDVTDGNNYNLELIHDSVREFFDDMKGFDLLNRKAQANHIGCGHYELAKACYTYLSMPELRSLPDLMQSHLNDLNFPGPETFVKIDQFPLLSYAFNFFGRHARSAEDKGLGLEFLLNSSLPGTVALIGRWSELPGSPTKMAHHDIRNECSDYVSLLHFLCGEGLLQNAEHYLQSLNTTADIIDMHDSRGKTPIFYVVRRARLFRSDEVLAKFIPTLTKYGAKPNTQTNKKETLLLVAVQHKMIACIKVLIEAGADVNLTGGTTDKTPLEAAVGEGLQNLDIVKLLLSKDARSVRRYPWQLSAFAVRHIVGLPISDGFDRCALFVSVLISAPTIVELLLSHVTPKNLKTKGAEQLIEAAFGRGRYDILLVLFNSPVVRKVLTKKNIAAGQLQLEKQNEIVVRGEKWTPSTIFGLQIGASVANTFNPHDATELSILLKKIKS